MRAVLLALLGLAGIGLLTYFCANQHRPAIESDLSGKTRQQLASIGLPAIGVEPEGQIITLRGRVADEAAKLKAGAAAAGIFGVSEVRNLLEVAPPPPPVPAVPVLTQEQRKQAVTCQERFNSLLTEPVRYATASTVVSPASYPLLDKLAAAAKLCPDVQIEIGGHTDSRGAMDMNMKLSQGRAESVVQYLAAKGLGAGRLSAMGYGPTKPVSDNSTEEGMSKNRRTEFKVKGL